MKENPKPLLPGDKKLLFTAFLNHQRVDCINATIRGVLMQVAYILDHPEDQNMNILMDESQAKKGDLVATGTIGKVRVDVLYEEWTMGEEGGVEPDGKLPEIKIH